MRKFLLMPVAIGVVAVFGGSVARTAPATTIDSDAIPNSASVAASGRVTAHLTKTSFTAAQAESVKLVYAFSPASARFGYLLSLKKGANWVTVRSINKTGSFKGSYTMTVKQLFGSNALKIGQYRVKVSADANSVTRGFTVVKPPSDGGSTITPRAGHWSGSLIQVDAPNSLSPSESYKVELYVTPDQTHVYLIYSFGFSGYNSCNNNLRGRYTNGNPKPVAANSFSTSPPGFYFSGTFDSPTSAHGTVGLEHETVRCDSALTGSVMVSTGAQVWTATWQDASQPSP
jgi:hypothetical protein